MIGQLAFSGLSTARDRASAPSARHIRARPHAVDRARCTQRVRQRAGFARAVHSAPSGMTIASAMRARLDDSKTRSMATAACGACTLGFVLMRQRAIRGAIAKMLTVRG